MQHRLPYCLPARHPVSLLLACPPARLPACIVLLHRPACPSCSVLLATMCPTPTLQGKIKGSYTAEKMLEFCRRGTLSSSQLLLGIDQNVPYLARQVSKQWGRSSVCEHCNSAHPDRTRKGYHSSGLPASCWPVNVCAIPLCAKYHTVVQSHSSYA